jgi:hypothetical protein
MSLLTSAATGIMKRLGSEFILIAKYTEHTKNVRHGNPQFSYG